MIYFNNVLKDNSPSELREFVSSYANNEDLAKKLEEDPKLLFSFVQNIKTVENKQQAEWLSMFLHKLTPEELESSEIKRVGTVLRNCGGFNRNAAPDLDLQLQGVENPPIKAHKSILALESPYFKGMARFEEFQKGKLVVTKEMEISSECMKKAVEYLYSSENDRENLIAALDKTLLPEMARLADCWLLKELKARCDEELCNSIGELTIDKNDLENWLNQSPYTPKFTLLLGAIARTAGDGDLNSIIDQMLTPEGASLLVLKCTPEEIEAFATLKTEFGKACQLLPETFGKAEWEKAFPITINEVPPLPPNIHAILELEDPCEPGKKLKETCKLFLRPKKVIFQGNGGNEELSLSFDGVEKLAQNTIDPARRTHYLTLDGVRAQMNSMPTAEAGWVLMRKELIPSSKNQSFENQQKLLKDSFEVPKVIDVVLLNILTFVSEGKYLYRIKPWTYTRCQEQLNDCQIVVGGFGSSGLIVFSSYFDGDDIGLSGAWKFF